MLGQPVSLAGNDPPDNWGNTNFLPLRASSSHSKSNFFDRGTRVEILINFLCWRKYVFPTRIFTKRGVEHCFLLCSMNSGWEYLGWNWVNSDHFPNKTLGTLWLSGYTARIYFRTEQIIKRLRATVYAVVSLRLLLDIHEKMPAKQAKMNI